MKTKIYSKISISFLAFLTLILFGATATLAQTPTLRANGKLAFTSDRDGNLEIYTMNNDGTGQVRLTNNPGVDDHPIWSPNGRKIAFVSQNPSGSFAIKLMNADGTNQIQLTPLAYVSIAEPWYDEWAMSWSPDGARIAFQENNEIFVINIDGSNRTNLTNHPAWDRQPSWSPDGSRIAFVRSCVHTMNADGSNVTALPCTGGNFFGDYSPDWSPIGNKIAYVAYSEESLPVIFIINADGSNRLIFEDGCISGSCSKHINKPKWSPDGTKIVFHVWEYFSNDTEIYVKNIGGSGFVQLTNTSGRNFHPSWQKRVATSLMFTDFDGDGRSDVSIYRPSDGTWYLNRSTQGFSATQFGLSTDKITPADYDGDGKTDIAVFRDGTWYWLNSSNGSSDAIQFGQAGDIPVPADFTGDGRAELAVFRAGVWFTWNLANSQLDTMQFGIATDKPAAADYDGDGKTDVAVFRPSNGTWYLSRSQIGFTAIQFGEATDKPVPADYDGDGKADVAVFRAASTNGIWYILQSSDNAFRAVNWGLSTDKPVPGDYDGDGQTDIAVYRNGDWYIVQSSNGSFRYEQFGSGSDMPVAANTQ